MSSLPVQLQQKLKAAEIDEWVSLGNLVSGFRLPSGEVYIDIPTARKSIHVPDSSLPSKPTQDSLRPVGRDEEGFKVGERVSVCPFGRNVAMGTWNGTVTEGGPNPTVKNDRGAVSEQATRREDRE